MKKPKAISNYSMNGKEWIDLIAFVAGTISIEIPKSGGKVLSFFNRIVYSK